MTHSFSDDPTSTLSTLYSMKNSQTSDVAGKLSNDQQFLSWLQSQPQTIANLQAIASLTSEIQNLTKSTDGLNATNQDLLSPYYTQDPRTSHIGFRSQGMADGGYVDVPGSPSANDNMVATIPVASGERIYVDAMPSKRGDRGGSQSITINLGGITVNSGGSADVNAIGRTVYQALQTGARQLQGAGK